MTVGTKLFAIMLFVAIVPLSISAVTTIGTYEPALERKLDELNHRTAEHGARATASMLETTQRTVRGIARVIPWATLSDPERQGAMLLIYEQLDDVVMVGLLDAAGNGVGASVYTPADRPSRHPTISLEDLAAFGRGIERSDKVVRTAPPVRAPGQRSPLLPIAFPIEGPDAAPWTLVVGLSVRGLCDELAATSPSGVQTRLLDGTEAILCGQAAGSAATLAATSRLANGWHVTSDQPAAEARAPITSARLQLLLWLVVGLVAAIVASFVLTLSIRRPLRTLTFGAEALATGDLSHRVNVTSSDELGTLARSFNRMTDSIQSKDLEIRSWNDELQQRVDARTAELRAAQEQLLESRKLGAVAALSAGIAHEINNPLTGVLGMTQLLLARKDSFDERALRNLTTIEREALRVRDIVERMQAIAQESVRDAIRIDVSSVVEAVAISRADKLASAHIDVERVYAADVPRVLGNATQLEHAISQLVDNSMKAMPTGGRLRLAVRAIENELVAIDIEDTGRGIPPELLEKIFEPFFTTKDDWRGVGLGLTLAHRIVEVHQGRIRASSQVGTGTVMTITLPAARHGAHLA
ncbi:MAG: Sensor histidine kinase [Myxococcales bacterium]|nr:Sensor histidine kinase [Myxococcales bacterium]